MARVFISHSSRDREAAAEMKTWLEQQGFEAPFLDFDKHSGIPPGADWERTLYREIDHCQALIIIQTANWDQSKWCFAEYTQARALGKPIFQLIDSQEAAQLRPIASDLQRLNLKPDRAVALDQLKRQLTQIALQVQGGFGWDPSRPPYPGLLAFEAEDAAIYFGRDPEIRALIERLTARRTLGGAHLVLLLGPSGSGKSSLLRAGLIPRLQRSGQAWLTLPPLRPQAQPCQALVQVLALGLGRGSLWRDLERQLRNAEASTTVRSFFQQLGADLLMAAAAPEGRILLSIDQAEELFSVADPEAAARFLRLLGQALHPDLPFLAVMTLRSDFLARLQAAEAMTIPFDQVSLPPLPMERIPEVIEGPARIAGLAVEPAFVQAAAADAETEDALPLLAFALRELVDRFGSSRRLSLDAYRALGDAAAGLSPLDNAVRRAAEQVLTSRQSDAETLRALRDAFVPALVRVNERGEYARRPARWLELPPAAWPLLEDLVRARLLTSRPDPQDGQRVVEVAHEALLRKWPLLRGWLDEAREFLIGRQQLEQDRRDWTAAGCPAVGLLSGLKLNRARIWLAARPQQLGEELRRYVEASLEAALVEERRRRRRRRMVLSGLSGLSLVAMTGGGLAWWQMRATQTSQYITKAEVQLDSDPLASMVNGLAALGRTAGAEAFGPSQTLVEATARNAEVDRLSSGQGQIWSLALLRDGDLISGGSDGTLRRWRRGKAVGAAVAAHPGGVKNLLALANGDCVSGGSDGTLRWWRQGGAIGPRVATEQAEVTALVELGGGEVISGGSDGSLRRWRDGRPVGQPILTSQRQIRSLVLLPDGELISAGSDGSLRRWRDGRPVGTPIDTGQRHVLSLLQLRNGELVSGGIDGTVRRWRDGRSVGPPLVTGQGRVLSLLQQRNGEVISGGEDGSLRRWRLDPVKPGVSLEEAQEQAVGTVLTTGMGAVAALVETPDGVLVSGGNDGSLRSWSFAPGLRITLRTGQGSVWSLARLSDGDLITGGVDGTLKRWQGSRSDAPPIATGQGGVRHLIVLPSDEVISSGTNGTLRRWRHGQPVGPPIQAQAGAGVRSLLLLRDGEVVSGGMDGSLQRWRDGRSLGAPTVTNQGIVLSLVETFDGEVISGGENGSLMRWRFGQVQGAPVMAGQGGVASLIQLRNGEIVSGGVDGSLRRWRGTRAHGRPVATSQGVVISLLQLANGDLLSGGSDGTLRLWRDGRSLGDPFAAGQGAIRDLLQTPDGTVISAGGQGLLRWIYPPRRAIQLACARLARHPVLQQPANAVAREARQTCQRFALPARPPAAPGEVVPDAVTPDAVSTDAVAPD